MKFRCNTCDKEFDHMRVMVKVIEGVYRYFDKHGELTCDCGAILESVPEFKGYGLYLGSFDSRSNEEKREILKKREEKHRRRDRVFRDYKRHIENGGKQ